MTLRTWTGSCVFSTWRSPYPSGFYISVSQLCELHGVRTCRLFGFILHGLLALFTPCSLQLVWRSCSFLPIFGEQPFHPFHHTWPYGDKCISSNISFENAVLGTMKITNSLLFKVKSYSTKHENFI